MGIRSGTHIHNETVDSPGLQIESLGELAVAVRLDVDLSLPLLMVSSTHICVAICRSRGEGGECCGTAGVPCPEVCREDGLVLDTN